MRTHPQLYVFYHEPPGIAIVMMGIFIGIHLKAPFLPPLGTTAFYLLKTQLKLFSEYWVIFLLMSSTAVISISKDKHWHKDCASDKTLLIYMINWLYHSSFLP